MITIARYSYHNLLYTWDPRVMAYVQRPLTGGHSLEALFQEPQIQLDRNGFETFIRSYLLFPWSKQDLAELIATFDEKRWSKRLSIQPIVHDKVGNPYPYYGKNAWFYFDEMYQEIRSLLAEERTPFGVPRLAEVQILIG